MGNDHANLRSFVKNIVVAMTPEGKIMDNLQTATVAETIVAGEEILMAVLMEFDMRPRTGIGIEAGAMVDRAILTEQLTRLIATKSLLLTPMRPINLKGDPLHTLLGECLQRDRLLAMLTCLIVLFMPLRLRHLYGMLSRTLGHSRRQRSGYQMLLLRRLAMNHLDGRLLHQASNLNNALHLHRILTRQDRKSVV